MILKGKKWMSVLLACAMVPNVLTGCGQTKNNSSEDGSSDDNGKTEIHYATWAVGTDVMAEAEGQILDNFREKYGDSIELVVEEVPSDSAYADKMKVLVATNELPNVVDGKNGVRDLAIENGQLIDLTEYLNADPDFRDNVIGADAIAANTTEDGKIYSVVSRNQSVGYFYNTEMFEQAGIKPAETWDEFWSNCDKLLEAGFTPLTLNTGENAWCTNLLLAAMIGGKGEAGIELMNTKYPETYQTPEVISALEDMQVALQKYTTPDAVGATYATVANYFLQEKTAMMFNGAWMIGDFSNEEKAVPGLEDHIAFALYPENCLIKTYPEGLSIRAGTKEEEDASWELLKELSSTEAQKLGMELAGGIPNSSEIELTEEYKEKNPLFAANVEAIGEADYTVATFDVMAYATVVDAFGQYYPELASGTLDAAGMAEKLDEAAAKSE